VALMALPSSVKIKKDHVEYTNSIDAAKYMIHELIRMALRDCGKLICKRTKQKIRKRTGRGAKNIQYWVRSKQSVPDLQVGIKPGGFYLGFQELGTSKMPKVGALSESVQDNIDEMQRIQAQYLSALNEDKPSIDSEDDYEGDGDN
jgi:HK97 gp10 family phage protein